MPIIDLKVLKSSPPGRGGPAVFAIVRDEAYFLPFFFAHYRALGVDHFLVYDDHSGDGTLEFLFAQPDCAVITSDLAFSDEFGIDRNGAPRRLPQALKETVPDKVMPGRWVLTADADEFLVLPEGVTDLPAFIRRLEQAGQPYATAPMVDFYGETLNHRNHAWSVCPFAANPYFDAGPYYDWEGQLTPQPRVAGFRIRLLLMLNKRHPEAFAGVFGEKVTAAAVWKAPLLKHGAGVARVGDHTLSVTPSTRIAAAFAHFKLYPGLDAKIDRALRERQYANRSLEYAFLDAARRLMGADSLVAAPTRRFTGPRSFQEAHLLPAT
jgi:hypothetical protein